MRRTFRTDVSRRSTKRALQRTVDQLRGTYSFYEARLVKYSGDGIATAGHEEIEFDLHGAITRSQGGSGPPGNEEIGAIRNRAELLRSHALAKQAVQTHQTN